MGAGSVALDAARSALMRATLEKGTAAGQWWAEALAARLAPTFTRVALRQMSGVWHCMHSSSLLGRLIYPPTQPPNH